MKCCSYSSSSSVHTPPRHIVHHSDLMSCKYIVPIRHIETKQKLDPCDVYTYIDNHICFCTFIP